TLERIFEPFFTTNGVGRGTGLGLATTFGIVRQSGGNIWVYSEPGRGTTFKVYLPLQEEAPDPLAPPEPAPRRTTEGRKVLVVEDEPRLRRMVVMVLEEAGYRPIAATGPLEALAIVRGGVVPDLLLTDVVMPQMSGRELSEALHTDGTDVPVLYMSGYTENTVVHHGVLDEGIHFLSKPFMPADLLRAIQRVFDG
ncbi:MAG: response regulator, partial [Myxococcales bacterium]|nr:response regulator [Myxococcales bacterium]